MVYLSSLDNVISLFLLMLTRPGRCTSIQCFFELTNVQIKQNNNNVISC